MNTLDRLCVPLTSVFDKSRWNVDLDITDLAENKIDPEDFSLRIVSPAAWKCLLENAFLRFERKSQQGLYGLTQAMGGGKTHTTTARQSPRCLFPKLEP
jgi:hypothetical protein